MMIGKRRYEITNGPGWEARGLLWETNESGDRAKVMDGSVFAKGERIFVLIP